MRLHVMPLEVISSSQAHRFGILESKKEFLEKINAAFERLVQEMEKINWQRNVSKKRWAFIEYYLDYNFCCTVHTKLKGRVALNKTNK